MVVSSPLINFSRAGARCRTPYGTQTGGGGRHLFYTQPPGFSIPSVGGWLPGVDIRSDGGHVILPEGKRLSSWLHGSARATDDLMLFSVEERLDLMDRQQVDQILMS